jgi:hypothetical protein
LGTKIAIWNQGVFHPELGKKVIDFDHTINPGPADDRVRIVDFEVLPDEKGDFISGSRTGPYDIDELDAVHSFGIIRYILKMYEDTLQQKIRWSWESDGNLQPLNVYIRNKGINARYVKSARCIQLDYFGANKTWTYYCRSVDIIAHETGHAILDALKPAWENGTVETRGMAEAFCDLTAMFVVTTQLDLCEIVLHENHGNFQKNSILSLFGAGFGSVENDKASIRNAINSRKFDEGYEFSYEYAEVLTGALYDLLIAMIQTKNASSIHAKDLFSAAEIWQMGILRSYISCNSENATIKEFGKRLMEHLPDFAEIIESIFTERLVR